MVFRYLDLPFGAGLAADGADHVAAVHPNHLFIQTEQALVPGADVDVVINARLHVLEVHYLVPESGQRVGVRAAKDTTSYCQCSSIH